MLPLGKKTDYKIHTILLQFLATMCYLLNALFTDVQNPMLMGPV